MFFSLLYFYSNCILAPHGTITRNPLNIRPKLGMDYVFPFVRKWHLLNSRKEMQKKKKFRCLFPRPAFLSPWFLIVLFGISLQEQQRQPGRETHIILFHSHTFHARPGASIPRSRRLSVGRSVWVCVLVAHRTGSSSSLCSAREVAFARALALSVISRIPSGEDGSVEQQPE